MAAFNMTSTPMIHTPGIVRWIREGIAPFDEIKAREILESGWGALTPKAVDNLLEGNYQVTGESIQVDG